KGGICPILNEQCKNLAEEGRTFEDFFGEQLKTNRVKLSKVERESERVAREVRAAREAEKAAARFETTRARLAHDRELLAEREPVAAAAGAEGPLTEDVSGVERRLRELGDPRSRAAALRAEAEREPEFSNELKGAGQALEALRVESRALDEKLRKFSALDAAW